jgi:CheY-like chemotaxis protein
MAHFLIADDKEKIRQQFALWLESAGHSYIEAEDITDIITAVRDSEEAEGFDMILLDHDFGGGEYGFEALRFLSEEFGPKYCEHRVIVITADETQDLPDIYASLGAINHLIKDIKKSQFDAAIRSALYHRVLFVDQQQDWEQALEVLQDAGIIEGYEKLSKDYDELTGQLEALGVINEKLQEALKKAGSQESQIAMAYEAAYEGLKNAPGDYRVIYPLLKPYEVSELFLEEIQDLFHENRLVFIALMNVLNRVQGELKCRVRKIAGTQKSLFEYRVARSYRLYYLLPSAPQTKVTLCRFGKKEVQNQIIEYLRSRDPKLANLMPGAI